MTATEQVQALPILGIICIPEVGFNAPLPITFLDLPPIDVIPNVLLVLTTPEARLPRYSLAPPANNTKFSSF